MSVAWLKFGFPRKQNLRGGGSFTHILGDDSKVGEVI